MKPYFPEPGECSLHTIFPGVQIRTCAGDKIMMSLVEFEPGAVVEEHSHPHEQTGMMLSGQAVFIVECLPCHRLNDGGASEAGPDLGWPMNPTQYLTEGGLRAIVRDPKSVRTWPEQRMAGFGKNVLPDSDLDALISYLRVMTHSGR